MWGSRNCLCKLDGGRCMITFRKLHRNSSNPPNFALHPPLWLLLPQVPQDSFFLGYTAGLRGEWEMRRGFPEGLPNREHPCGRCSQGQRTSGDRQEGVPETSCYPATLSQWRASDKELGERCVLPCTHPGLHLTPFTP